MRSLTLIRLTLATLAIAFGAATAQAAPQAATPAAPTPGAPTATAGTVTTPAAPAPGPPAPAKAPVTSSRIALLEMVVEGEDPSPALTMQLQDGFVLALVTGGVPVVDPVDIAHRLAALPELQKCESSPCLKRLGQVLGVRFAVRVRIAMSGNNYKMTARVFSTEGSTPAALPIVTKTRPCDVCTETEARDIMIRLADDLRPHFEEKAPPLAPIAPPPAPPRSRLRPALATGVGVAAFLTGIAVVIMAPSDSKAAAALGGGLAGVGLSTAGLGLYKIVSF